MSSDVRRQELLANPVTIEVQQPSNRFASDFVPDPVTGSSSVLVQEALLHLSQPRKLVRRNKSRFEIANLPKRRHCVHIIDQEAGANDTIDPISQEESTRIDDTESPSNSGKSRPQLSDLFSSSTEIKKSTAGSVTLREKRSEMMKSSSNLNLPPQASCPLQYNKELSLDPKELFDPELIRKIPLNTASRRAVILAQEHRDEGFYWHYQPDYVYPGPLEESEGQRKEPPEWGARPACSQLLTVVKRFSIALGHIEPLFCSMALYDLRPDGGKISENFFFDLNTEEVLSSTLSVFRFSADEITLCKNAIFSIPDRHEGIHLVVRIERVLQGDPDDAFEPYLKDKKFMGSQRDLDKVTKRMRNNINRLAAYRQSFAVAVLPLFSETGELIQDGEIFSTDKLFIEKQPEEESQFLERVREYASLLNEHVMTLKRKIIPSAELAFSISLLDDDRPTNTVDPSLIPLKPLPNSAALDEKLEGVTREVELLPLPSSVVSSCYDHFVNSLFVYPLKVQFQKYRNICCKVELRLSDASVDMEGVKTIFGKSSATAFCSSALTSVSYHNRSPSMLEEFKIMLPLHLNEQAHLFFSFFQVACQKKVGKATQELIGYSCMPIFKAKQVAPDGIYNLPIAARLPDNYLKKFEARKETPAVHFRMHSSDCFRVRLHLLSSVFCQDVCLNKFLNTLPDKDTLTPQPSGSLSVAPDPLVETAVEYVRHVKPQALVQYLPTILNYMFGILLRSEAMPLQGAAFRSIDVVVHRVGQFMEEASFRTGLVASYVRNVFDGTGRSSSASEPILALRVLALFVQSLRDLEEDESNVQKQVVLRNAWFWFEVVFKSLAQEQARGNLCTDVESSVALVLRDLLSLLSVRMASHRSVMGVSALKAASNSLALFLTDLFSVLPHHYVTELIIFYFESIEALKDSVMLDFKIRFIDLVFDFDAFLSVSGLNSGLDLRKILFAGEDIVHALSDSYPLAAMLVRFLDRHLDFSEKTLRGQVINCVRRILTKHDFDSSISKEKKGLVAAMYLPILQACADQYRVVVAMSLKQQRVMLSIIVWIVKTCDEDVMLKWVRSEDAEIIASLCLLLRLAVQVFAYAGRVKRCDQVEFDSILSEETAATLLGVDASEIGTDLKSNIETLMSSLRMGSTNMKNQSVRGRSKLSLRQRRAQMAASGSTRRVKRVDTYNTQTIKRGGTDLIKKILSMEASLNTAVGSTVVQFCIVMLSERWNAESLSDPCCPIGGAFLTLLSSVLEFSQELSVSISLYPLMRVAITSAQPYLFSTPKLTEATGEFARGLMGHCTSHNRDMRSFAASLLFLIAQANVLSQNSLDAFQEAVTVSLSQMVSQLGGKCATYLDQAFASILIFNAKSDLNHQKQNLLDKLIVRVRGILTDTREIVRQEQLARAGLADIAVYAELLVHMSLAYTHLPKVQLHWLRRLADQHNKNACYAEAAKALTNLADLIHALKLSPESGPDWRQVESWGGMNVYEHLTGVLRESCNALDRAQLYEQCNEEYKKLIPIFEQHQDYKQLSKAHLHLNTVFDQLVKAISSESRLFGSYYRVGFYGEKFGPTLDTKEFIYKMPKITRLAEMVDHLKSIYGRQLHCSIRIWPDSGPVDTSRFGADEAVVQVTYVTPYFDEQELQLRSTFVQLNTDLKRFMFSTPFTTEAGKAHANDVTMQQRRNTIMTVKYPFPCLLTRQPVQTLEQVILSPVESSTENIQMRIEKMKSIIHQEKPDRRQLTSVLQGSVMLQVHGGAKEICLAFFGDGSEENPPLQLEGLEELRKALFEFLDVCDSGVELYGQLLDSLEDAQRQAAVSNASPSRHESEVAAVADTNLATERVVHNEIEKHCRQLRQQMTPSLRTAKKKMKANVRFAVSSSSSPK